MKTSKFILILSLLTCGASVADPTPTIRFDQPSWFPAFPNLLTGGASHRNNQAFDNFSFPTPQRITEVRWEGIYQNLYVGETDSGVGIIDGAPPAGPVFYRVIIRGE